MSSKTAEEKKKEKVIRNRNEYLKPELTKHKSLSEVVGVSPTPQGPAICEFPC